MIVGPSGKVISSLDDKEGLIVADLDFTEVDDMRMSMPTYQQKRRDIYSMSQ